MKALIVDESGQISERLQPALAQEGYLVDTARERGEALWLAGESDVDVVVVCSSRPGVHDLPTITALRDDGEAAPILVMARQGESADTVAALDAGADDVVISPVPFSEVAARLRALTRRAPELVEEDLRVGTLRLDRAARTAIRVLGDAVEEVGRHETDAGVRSVARASDSSARPGVRAEVEIQLSAREYALLELLMRHPGQVLSRTRIVEHVWGPHADGTSNLVDQVVSHLRAKLDRPFERHDILTVRGAGYRIVDGQGGVASAA